MGGILITLKAGTACSWWDAEGWLSASTVPELADHLVLMKVYCNAGHITFSDDVSSERELSIFVTSDLPEFKYTCGKILWVQIPFCCQIACILSMHTSTHCPSIVNHTLQKAPSFSN